MEAPDTCSSLLTSLSPDDYDEHNMWNPMLGLFCHVHVGAIMELYLDEADLVKITLSFHFALDVLCENETLCVQKFWKFKDF